MDAWQFGRLQNLAERHNWTKFITMQNQYNLIYREDEHEMMPLCLDRAVVDNLEKVAHEHGRTMAQESLAEDLLMWEQFMTAFLMLWNCQRRAIMLLL